MDSTKEKIIAAATQVFLEKGFSGATINDIANTANIHKSLIYHHVGNKQKLWQVVKDGMLTTVDTHALLDTFESFEQFVENTVKTRIKLYQQQPNLLRLMQWQNLDPSDSLVSNHPLSPTLWKAHIETLQKKGRVKGNYPASLIALYLHSLIQGVLVNNFDVFTQNENFKKEIYIQMIIKEVTSSFEKRPEAGNHDFDSKNKN